MEALRSQLAETQGALTEKIHQTRQLRADHREALTAWTQQKQDFEAKIRQLETEVQRLRQGNESTARPKPPHTQGQTGRPETVASMLTEGVLDSFPRKPGFSDDTIVVKRSRMQLVEAKYKSVTRELAEKTELCNTLQRELQAKAAGVGGGSFRVMDSLDITDDQIIKRWEKLQLQIRTLSIDRFNETVQLKLVSEKRKTEFEHLSTHWKTYLNNESLTCYIFRALIWRYLHTCLLAKYCRVWGKEKGDAAAKLAELFASRASGAEFESWRMHTAQLLHKACEPSQAIVADVIAKIFEATTPFASGIDTEELKRTLTEIVTAAAELSTILARSRYLVLMSDKPGSDSTRGFKYQAATMEVRGKLGSEPIVDMMLSPCLLKKEEDYSVLVKADVIC